MDALFTWTTLATIAGAATMTFIIVAYTKTTLDKLVHISTDLYGAFIGALILFGAGSALGTPINWQTVLLDIFNGFIVAMAAGKMNDKAVAAYSAVQAANTITIAPITITKPEATQALKDALQAAASTPAATVSTPEAATTSTESTQGVI